ncbi:hypothetical protein GCM10020227_46600 [Streptomyces flavovirens]
MPAHCSSDQESYCSALIWVCIQAGVTISAVMACLLRGASTVSAGGTGYCPVMPGRPDRVSAVAGRYRVWSGEEPGPTGRDLSSRAAIRRRPAVEAFEEARARDVSVLLGVAYAGCHWCP